MAERGTGSRVALAGKLFGSTALAQGAALVATTVAATRTGPVDFAIFAAVRAATAVVSSVNALAVETRLPVVADEDAGALVRVATAAVLGSTLLGLVAGAVGHAGHQAWGMVVLLTAPSCLAVSAGNLLTSAAIRENRPHLLARNRVVAGFANAALVIALVFTPLPGYLALTLAFIVATLLADWVLVAGLPGWLGLGRPPRRHDWGAVRREVRWQPLTNLAANLGTSLPAILLPALGATVVAGAWALLSRIMNAVVNVVFSTASPIFNTECARLVREGTPDELRALHRRWLARLLLFTVPSVLGIIVGVRWIVPLLGDQWRSTSLVLVPACLSSTVLMVWLPMSQTLVLLGRTGLELGWTLANLAVSAAPLAMVGAWGGQRALTVWAALQVASLVVHVALQRRAIARLVPTPPGRAAPAG